MNELISKLKPLDTYGVDIVVKDNEIVLKGKGNTFQIKNKIKTDFELTIDFLRRNKIDWNTDKSNATPREGIMWWILVIDVKDEVTQCQQ